MLKAIHTELQIKTVSIKKDDSISFTAATPELTDAELAAFRQLGKVTVNALLEPQTDSGGVLEIKEKIDDGKSPSQRLRAILYVYFEQKGRPGDDFEVFYRMQIEKIIGKIKEQLT